MIAQVSESGEITLALLYNSWTRERLSAGNRLRRRDWKGGICLMGCTVLAVFYGCWFVLLDEGRRFSVEWKRRIGPTEQFGRESREAGSEIEDLPPDHLLEL